MHSNIQVLETSQRAHGGFDLGGEASGSDLQIAGSNKVPDLSPIDLAAVEAEADPSSRADISGQIELARMSSHERIVFAGQRLGADGDDAVAMVMFRK